MARISLVIILIVAAAIVKINYFTAKQGLQTAGDNIIFIAMPKSASESVAEDISRQLGYRQLKISAGYVPHDQIQYKAIDHFFKHRHVITKQHLDPSVINLQFIKKYTDRIIVHVRDPREVVLSWVYHLNRLHSTNADYQLYKISPMPPAEYFDWEISQQIDWNLDNFLPQLVEWMNGWIAVAESEANINDGLKVIFTRFDDFRHAKEDFYSNIYDFYSIQPPNLRYLAKLETPKINFRKGYSKEWRTVYNSEQKRKIALTVSDKLLEHFGWQQ